MFIKKELRQHSAAAVPFVFAMLHRQNFALSVSLKRWTKLFAFVLICADFIIGTSVVLPTKEQLLFYSFFVPASQAASSIS